MPGVTGCVVRGQAADAWYAEAARRKSEHMRKFEETGVEEVAVDEFGTPLRFLAKKGFRTV